MGHGMVPVGPGIPAVVSAAEEFLAFALAPTRLSTFAPRARTPRAPRGLERRYETALRTISRALSTSVARQLAPVLATATDGPRQDALLDLGLAFVRVAGLRLNLLRIVQRASPILDRFGRMVAEENAREMRRVLPISIADQSVAVQAALELWRRENSRLLSSLADRLSNDVGNLVTQAATSGMRVETLQRRLRERFRVSESRSKVIARDQVLSFNGHLTQARHLEAGVSQYEWSTSGDERVRDSHRALNGQIFSWDNPPEVGHPGEDILCRCVAVPVLD